MRGLKKAKECLLSGEYTCVLYKEDALITSTRRGVSPLVKWLEAGDDFNGYYAADKVVGKATAFLYVLLGVTAVYARVISEPALEVLKTYEIEVVYDTVVEHIINRQGDGICPFEAAILTVDTAETAYKMILDKMKEMGL